MPTHDPPSTEREHTDESLRAEREVPPDMAESALAQGSTFYFTIPLARAPQLTS